MRGSCGGCSTSAPPVDGPDKFGNTALERAAAQGFVDVVETLLGAGADPSPRVERSPPHAAAKEGRADVVKVLLAAGVPVDAPLQDKTALCLATQHRKHEVIDVLLAAGATVDDPVVREARAWKDAALVARLEAARRS